MLYTTGRLARSESARFQTKSGLLTARADGNWIALDFPAFDSLPATPPSALVDAVGVHPIETHRVDRKGTDDYWILELASEAEVHGAAPTHWERSSTFDILRDSEERGVAGSPATVIEWLSRHIAETGANTLVGQHQFGDMTLAETLGSLELFAAKVMPELRRRFPG